MIIYYQLYAEGRQMKDKTFFVGLLLIIIGLNFHIINRELYYFGIFGSFLIGSFLLLINNKSQFQRIILIACIVVLKMLMIGEIIKCYEIESYLFSTTDYNMVFLIQIIYILVISSLIGLYYDKKIKKHRS